MIKSNAKTANDDFPFKRALKRSLLLHAAIILIVMVRVAFPSHSARPMGAQSLTIENNPTPIQAAVVDGKALDAEVARQERAKAAQLAKVAAEKQRILNEQKKLKAEKEKLELARKAEAKRLADLKAEKKAAEVALQAEKKRAQEAKKLADAAQAKSKQAAAAATKAKQQSDLAKALAAERMPATNADAGALSGDSLREIDRYKLMVQQQIMRNWFVQGAPTSGVATQLFVRVAPNGTVLDVKISRSSGNDALDRSAMAAVFKASPLPVPQDPALFNSFRELRLTLRPDAVVSEG